MNLFLILLFPVLIVFYILIKLEMPGGKEVIFKKIIRMGSVEVSKVYVGAFEITKMYLGSNKIFGWKDD